MKKVELVTLFSLDSDRATKIASIIYPLFVDRKGIFKDYEMPEWFLPRGVEPGSKEHALYLTYIISVDFGVDAVKLWKNARGKYELYPECFDPRHLLKISPTTTTRVLRDLGIRYVKGGTRAWKEISKILLDEFEGDPRKITPKETTIKEVKRRLQKFPHLKGRKLSNFYIRAMNERGLFKISDMQNLDIPVDLQVARFTVYTGVLKLEKGSFEGCIHNNPIRSLIEEVWRTAAEKIGRAPYELDEPIWTVGSKLCSKKKCGKCPVSKLCGHNFGVQLKKNRLIWSV